MNNTLWDCGRLVLAGALALSIGALPTRAFAASVRVETWISASPAKVWAAVRDVRGVKALAPGFVVDEVFAGDNIRIITFANGAVARELIVSIDDDNRRLGYTNVGGRAAFHFASIQVVADGGGSRLIWVTDILPDELKIPFGQMMEAGAAVIKKTLEATAER